MRPHIPNRITVSITDETTLQLIHAVREKYQQEHKVLLSYGQIASKMIQHAMQPEIVNDILK